MVTFPVLTTLPPSLSLSLTHTYTPNHAIDELLGKAYRTWEYPHALPNAAQWKLQSWNLLTLCQMSMRNSHNTTCLWKRMLGYMYTSPFTQFSILLEIRAGMTGWELTHWFHTCEDSHFVDLANPTIRAPIWVKIQIRSHNQSKTISPLTPHNWIITVVGHGYSWHQANIHLRAISPLTHKQDSTQAYSTSAQRISTQINAYVTQGVNQVITCLQYGHLYCFLDLRHR